MAIAPSPTAPDLDRRKERLREAMARHAKAYPLFGGGSTSGAFAFLSHCLPSATGKKLVGLTWENARLLDRSVALSDDVPDSANVAATQLFASQSDEAGLFSKLVRLYGLDGRPPEWPSFSAKIFIESLSTEAMTDQDGPLLVFESDEARDRFTGGFTATELRRFTRDSAPLMERVNQQALQSFIAADHFSSDDYAFFAAPEKTGEWRRQAAASYPLLATEFAAPAAISLQAAIDEGTPLEPLLASRYAITKPVSKALRKIQWPSQGVPPSVVTGLLAACPPDWAPKNELEWRAFCDVAATVDVVAGITQCDPAGLVAASKGKWCDFVNRMVDGLAIATPPEGEHAVERGLREKLLADVRAGEPARRSVLLAAAEEAAMMSHLFGRQVIGPMVMHVATRQNGFDPIPFNGNTYGAVESAAAKILFEGKGAIEIIAASQKFSFQTETLDQASVALREEMRRKDEIAAAKVGLSELRTQLDAMCAELVDQWRGRNVDWLPLTPTMAAPNGLLVTPLTSFQMFYQESYGKDHGTAMNICVGRGSYTDHYQNICRKDGAHIVSIRRLDSGTDYEKGTFTRLATIEFYPITNRSELREVRTRQRRGYSNGDIPEEADQALEWYMSGLRDGRIPVDIDALEAARNLRVNGNPEQQRRRAELESAIQAGEGRFSSEMARLQGLSEANRKPPAQDPITISCHYDWRDSRQIVAAWKGWGATRLSMNNNEIPPILGKKWRNLGANGLAESTEIREIAKTINPWCAENAEPDVHIGSVEP